MAPVDGKADESSFSPTRRMLWKRCKAAFLELVCIPYVTTALWAFALAGWLRLYLDFDFPAWPAACVSIGLYWAVVCYLLSRDWAFGQAGVFRSLAGLRVISESSGAPITIVQSCLRNCILTLPAMFAVLPLLFYTPVVYSLDTWGAVAYAAVLVFEGAMVLLRKDRRRLGDLMAGTRVIELTEPAVSAKRARFMRIFAYLLLRFTILITLVLLALHVFHFVSKSYYK